MSEFHSLLQNDLPSKGAVGDFYYCTDTRNLFLALGDGGLINTDNMFSGPGLQGPKGDTGSSGPPVSHAELLAILSPVDAGTF